MQDAINVKITVNKEKTNLAGKNSFKFKASKKTKKVKVTLKDSKNNPVKSVQVTLKLKGKVKGKKSLKAKTNSKGVVTFKITSKRKIYT